MVRRWALSISAALIVCGCDAPPTTTVGSSPRPLAEARMNNDPDNLAGGAPSRLVRFEDMDAEQARRMRDMIARAE